MQTIDSNDLTNVTGGTGDAPMPPRSPGAEAVPGKIGDRARVQPPAQAVPGLNLGDLIKTGGDVHYPQGE